MIDLHLINMALAGIGSAAAAAVLIAALIVGVAAVLRDRRLHHGGIGAVPMAGTAAPSPREREREPALR